MPDEVIAAPSAEPTQAEPSPATNHQEVLNNLSSEQRTKWRMTGELPGKAESAPAKEDSATDKVETAPASEAGHQEKPKRDNAETRLKELLADLKTAGLTPAELKTFKREAAAAQPKAESTPAPKPEVKVMPVSSPEAPKEPSIDDPKYTGDEGWKLYEADVRKYNREFSEFTAKQAVEKFKQETIQKQQAEKVAKEFEAAQSKYADYKDKTQPLIDALTAELQAAPEAKTIHPVVLDAIGSNPLCAEILYVIGPEKDAFLALARSNPVAALEKVAVIKHLISEELAKSPKEDKPRDEKGQFQGTPEKKITGAPPPPKEFGGTAAAPGDKVGEAVQKRDFASYKNEMNRREMATKRS